MAGRFSRPHIADVDVAEDMILLSFEAVLDAPEGDGPPHAFHFVAEAVAGHAFLPFLTAVIWESDEFGRDRLLLEVAFGADLSAFEGVVIVVHLKSNRVGFNA